MPLVHLSLFTYQGRNVQFINNSAVQNGGGVYLAANPKVYILKERPIISPNLKTFLVFENYSANYGGAVYVADNTSSGACLPEVECFVQIATCAISTAAAKRIHKECKHTFLILWKYCHCARIKHLWRAAGQMHLISLC